MRVAPINSTMTSWLVSGRPRQFMEMWLNSRTVRGRGGDHAHDRRGGQLVGHRDHHPRLAPRQRQSVGLRADHTMHPGDHVPTRLVSGQEQPGAGHRTLVIKGHIDLVQQHPRGWHRRGVLRLGDRDCLAAVILPGQGTLFLLPLLPTLYPIGGSRLRTTPWTEIASLRICRWSS